MVQLTKTASRLLSRVKNEKWASSDDHEDPIEIEEAFINADPLSSSDGEDANERANIAPSRFTYPARRNAPVAKEHSKKSPRITENEDTREDGSIREIGAAKKAEYKLPDQLQYGRDDVVFGAQGAKPSKRTRKTFINIHATASTVDSTNKNVGPGRNFQPPPRVGTAARPSKDSFKAPPSACGRYGDEELASGDSSEASQSASAFKSSAKRAKKSAFASETPRIRVPRGKLQTAAKEPPRKSKATFKSFILSQTTSGSTPSSPPTSTLPSGRTGFTPEPDKEVEPDPIDSKCPMCGSEVGFLELEIFLGECKGTRPTVREQQDFCVKHRKREAEQIWEEQGYPNIDWDYLSDRLSKYHSSIKRLLAQPRESHFRREMDKRAKHGSVRTLLQQMEKEGFDEVSLGYYGTRGLALIVDYIMANFSERIRNLGGSDRTIANRGPSGYVQMVLAPELATLLIMEDMSVDEERAREIMKESIEVGDRLHGREEGEQGRVMSLPMPNFMDEDDGEDDWTRTQIV